MAEKALEQRGRPKKPRNPNPIGLTPWPKGVSGNPSGRPKVRVSIAEEAGKHALEALQTLVDCLRSDATWGVKVRAAETILDRAFGRPQVSIDVDRTDRRAIYLGIGQLGPDAGSPAASIEGDLVQLLANAEVQPGGDTTDGVLTQEQSDAKPMG